MPVTTALHKLLGSETNSDNVPIGGQLPPAVAYPGGTYHTSCAVHMHARLVRNQSTASRWEAIMHALADSEAASAHSVKSHLDKLQKVLERGDPMLDRRLVQFVALDYEPVGQPVLPLPDVP
jgi:hypothetical protein